MGALLSTFPLRQKCSRNHCCCDVYAEAAGDISGLAVTDLTHMPSRMYGSLSSLCSHRGWWRPLLNRLQCPQVNDALFPASQPRRLPLFSTLPAGMTIHDKHPLMLDRSLDNSGINKSLLTAIVDTDDRIPLATITTSDIADAVSAPVFGNLLSGFVIVVAWTSLPWRRKRPGSMPSLCQRYASQPIACQMGM